MYGFFFSNVILKEFINIVYSRLLRLKGVLFISVLWQQTAAIKKKKNRNATLRLKMLERWVYLNKQCLSYTYLIRSLTRSLG